MSPSSENGSDPLGRHARIAAILQHPGQHMRNAPYDKLLHLPARLLHWSAGAWADREGSALRPARTAAATCIPVLRLISNDSLMFVRQIVPEQ